ncbi:hypothetical protein UFOVP361_13 [uncultured Caudovirales phage]|uniref:Uncharacterized protein n=1 Tax=uncultured Caudovirales phage TaxID=2100421 RepID=A0A6J7WZ61_9CAUD|nr:hypothetical protein UFOVP361_13 [uncultured Caudovirales phage]
MTGHTGIMDLLIKTNTPFGNEDYKLSIKENNSALVSFRENTIEIPNYTFSKMGFYAIFNIDVPMSVSVLLTLMQDIGKNTYSGIVKIGAFTTVNITAVVL